MIRVIAVMRGTLQSREDYVIHWRSDHACTLPVSLALASGFCSTTVAASLGCTALEPFPAIWMPGASSAML